MEQVAPGPWTVWTLGPSDDERLAERERLFVRIRWAVAVFAVLAVAGDAGRSSVAAAAVPGLVVAANVTALLGLRRLHTVPALTVLGLTVNLADGVAAATAMFNYAHEVDTATSLLLMLVVLEAAVRWARLGGVVGGLLAAVLAIVWMLHRDASFGVEFETSTAFTRAGAYVLTGTLLGVVIRALDVAGREIRRGLRRTDAVGRFAIEAPRLTVEEAARRLAGMLHDDLDFERAAVVVVGDDDPEEFRLVATAGYEHLDVEAYRSFPVSVGIVGRCFTEADAQFLPDVAADPDYLEVDPDTRSEMSVPLRAGDRVFGVIDVASTRPEAFGLDDLRFLETVAAQVGRAFDTARVVEMERRTIAELERLSATKDDFIAIANHELRTPITAIAGFAQSLATLRDELTDEEVEDAIERISRQSAHLKRLLDDLLTLPRNEGPRRRGPPSGRPVHVDRLAEEVVRELDPHDGKHRLAVEAAPDVPPVRGHPDEIHRVLTNLVSNAVKYSPEGGLVTVRVRAEGPMVRVEVVDEGVGIAEDDQPLLFTKFGRIEAGEAARSGMGLGLFIVKELVEDMGGTVGVESALGEGSTFWVLLPAARGEESPAREL